jgi:hypothetical protein
LQKFVTRGLYQKLNNKMLFALVMQKSAF